MGRGDARAGGRQEYSGLRKGTTVLSEDPFAFILYSRYRKQRCDYCFAR